MYQTGSLWGNILSGKKCVTDGSKNISIDSTLPITTTSTGTNIIMLLGALLVGGWAIRNAGKLSK